MKHNKYKEFIDGIDKKAYHEGEWQWEEDGYTVTRTNHWSPPGCHNACGVLLYTKDNKLEKVEGDPLSPFVNGRLCMRCLDLVEAVNHPDRLKYPLRRAGERGENKWERITWDEALDEVADRVRDIHERVGGHAILTIVGTGRNIGWQVPYLCHCAFKSPNQATFGFTGYACYLPRVYGSLAPLGDYPDPDASQTHEDRYANDDFTPPGVVVMWGNEPLKSNADGYMGHWLVECVQMGTRIISIDPRLTWWGARADYFLQVRPGTDAAIACAWLNIIITEDLYDHEFVELWCAYFDELAESVKDCTAEWAAEITGCDAADILASARMYATTKPAAIKWGLAMDQQMSAMSLCMACCDLMAITGNIDVPGGNILERNAFNIINASGLEEDLVPMEWREKKLTDRFCFGEDRAEFTDHASSDALVYAMETGKPYPIEMVWIESSNTLSCPGMDAGRVRKALLNVPFIVDADPFMTPTAIACADIVLPVAMSPERYSIRIWWTPLRSITKVLDYYEAKSDEDIILELGRRLDPKLFPWDTAEEFVNWHLTDGALIGEYEEDESDKTNMRKAKFKERGFTDYKKSYRELVEQGGYEYDEWNGIYKKYEKGLLRDDKSLGFSTPTGRIELTPLIFELWGVGTTPHHTEPTESPVSTPNIAKEYPLVLTAGGRSYEFFHSEHRQLPTMREFHPWPLLTINPKTAEKYGIIDGEWVWVENDHGRFRQVAKVSNEVDENTVHAEHGWWFPEEEGAEPQLFGTFNSNVNNCTKAFETAEGGIGSSIKCMLCKIYPYKEGDTLPQEQIIEKGGYFDYEPGSTYSRDDVVRPIKGV